MNNFSFIQVTETMKLPDGVYNGRYNKEPALIRIENNIPVWVQFIGFVRQYEGEDKKHYYHSCIYDARGILVSSVEVLLKSQEL